MVVVADVADYKAMCLPSPGGGVIYDRVGPVLTHAQWARHGPGGTPDTAQWATVRQDHLHAAEVHAAVVLAAVPWSNLF